MRSIEPVDEAHVTSIPDVALQPALRLRGAKAKTKLENLCYTPPYAHYPLIGHWNLSLLPPCMVVQEAGSRISEPNRTRGWDRTPRAAWASGVGIIHHKDGWIDSADGCVGDVGCVLHSKNSLATDLHRFSRIILCLLSDTFGTTSL